jgi:hypothetical protein
MANPTKRAETTSAPTSNGKGVPQRAATATATGASGIPARGTEGGNYEAWRPEVDDLRSNLGNAARYDDVEKVQSLAQGLRRTFGVTAVTRNVDKTTKRGTLWVEYPSILHDDGSRTEDTATVQETLAKYAK